MGASASDVELVAAAGRGDKEAFGTLVARHRRVALGACTRFLGDADLATDMVQEAVVIALVQLERLDDPERFGSWLCGIALNLARRRLRQAQRLALVPFDLTGVADVWSDPAGDPADAALHADLRRRVRHAVAGLAPGQREAVLLFYLQGLSYREVAAELDISVNAVKARLHQARAALEPRLAVARPAVPSANTVNKEAPMPDVEDTSVEMHVREVRRSPDGSRIRRHVIVLEAATGERILPIWVGPAEATALAVDLENIQTPRPMTYHFTANLLAASGASVREVRITQLREGTFYAVVAVDGAAHTEVDARPSDAINLAVVTGTPIRVDAAVLDADLTRWRPDDWSDYEVATATIADEVQTWLTQSIDRRPGEEDSGT